MPRKPPARDWTRRNALQLLGTGGLVGTAGCSSLVDIGSDGRGGGEQTTTTARTTTTEATTETTEEEQLTITEPSGAIAGVPVPSDPGTFGYATMGTGETPVTATMYGAWFCPYTNAVVADFLNTLVTEYVEPGKVTLTFRAVPYDDGEGFHGPDEPKVARAALAVWNRAPERYWSFFHYMFANIPAAGTWSVEDVLKVAEAAGVEAADPIRRAYERTATYRDEIAATMERVREIPIRAVPRIVVGETISKPSVSHQETIDQLEAALQESTGGETGGNETSGNETSGNETVETSGNETTGNQTADTAGNETTNVTGNETTGNETITTAENETTGNEAAVNETANTTENETVEASATGNGGTNTTENETITTVGNETSGDQTTNTTGNQTANTSE